jgi:hypothetical protein
LTKKGCNKAGRHKFRNREAIRGSVGSTDSLALPLSLFISKTLEQFEFERRQMQRATGFTTFQQARMKAMTTSFIRGVLLIGRFRSFEELNSMSHDDQRNSLIVELAARTNQPAAHFQGFDDGALAGAGAALVFLRTIKARTDEQLKTISADDQRNLLIIAIGHQTAIPGPQLQAMTNSALVDIGLGNGATAMRGVLLLAPFRTFEELNRMSHDDHRNALIVEMSRFSSMPVGHYQSLDDAALSGVGANLVFLRGIKARTDEQLKAMTDDDQRNLMIIAMHQQSRIETPKLQAMTNLQLAGVALGARPPRSISEATEAILSHYPRVGGPTGSVGIPMGPVKPIPGGFMRQHAAGHIQLLDADIGPQGFHTMEASVRFVGFRCHQQSEKGPDEPYFIIGLQGFRPGDDDLKTFGPFEGSEGVQTGDNRVLEEQLTTTMVPPFVIRVTAMENDSGSPTEASAAVEKGMMDGTAKLTAALAPISPQIVFAVGGALQAALGVLGGPLADGLSSLLGMGDDFIGQGSMTFFEPDASKDEWLNPPAKKAPAFTAPFTSEIVLDNGEGGRYSAYFDVKLSRVDRVIVATET